MSKWQKCHEEASAAVGRGIAHAPDDGQECPIIGRKAMINDPVRANPLFGNPLLSRDDVQRAARDLFSPLLPFFSNGGARVRLSAGGAVFDRAAADLEGFARPLWGLAALAAGGGRFCWFDLYRRGLQSGTDPDHLEYWGALRDRNQRLVELAAIGFALRLVPHLLWEPLGDRSKALLAAYLLDAHQCEFVESNWQFFRVLIALGLEHVGIETERSLTRQSLDQIDRFHLGGGWYRDGAVRQIDHYVPFAFHFYGLIYAELAQDDGRAAIFRERARSFAPQIRHWYGPDGAALPFGRSLTYRFAAAGFWGALAFAGVEALPWGEIKGYYLRHLRWWAARPIADRDGVLSIGYGYPNLLISESYNSAGSPYWAFKAFLPLALPNDHPFWSAKEQPAPDFAKPVALRHPGMVVMHTPGNVVVLASGQEHRTLRGGAEKYSKFVYSTRYGFGVEADDRNFAEAAFDGTIGFSDDDVHLRMRESNEDARIAGACLYARWRPWRDVIVETWLVPAAPWHIRVHRIATPRGLRAIEGGFAISSPCAGATLLESCCEGAVVISRADVSAIVDIGGRREARVFAPAANTNVLAPRTQLPQLVGEIAVGTTVLVTAAMGLPCGKAALDALKCCPKALDIFELEALMVGKAKSIAVFSGLR